MKHFFFTLTILFAATTAIADFGQYEGYKVDGASLVVASDIGELKINISGCMNACGHHHVGHIGILGVDKRGEEFFQLTLGGSSDQHASLGDRLGPALPQNDVPDAIAAIVDEYRKLRNKGERFLDTYRRVGMDPFKLAVYGEDKRKAVA